MVDEAAAVMLANRGCRITSVCPGLIGKLMELNTNPGVTSTLLASQLFVKY